MKDSTRRTVLFVIVVIAGSVLVVFDIPAIVMLIGIIALAVLVLFINGSIRLPKISLKRQRAAKTKPGQQQAAAGAAGVPKMSWFRRGGKPADKATRPVSNPGRKAGSGTSGDFFSSLTRAFSVLASDITKAGTSRGSKEQKKKKIDELLDSSITGNVSDIRSLKDANPEMIPASRKTVEDPFTTLVKEPINTELLDSAKSDVDISSLSDINLDEELGTSSLENDISHLDVALDVEEEKITIDDDSDDEVANILAAHQEELGTGDAAGDKSPLTADMSNLEELDIGSIDLDEELDLEGDLPEPEKAEASTAPAKAAAPKEPEKPAAAQPAEKPKKMEDSMVAFSTGKGEDDDLMSSLKSEATKTKKESHASLVRDLKGINVPVQDLEKELEGFLSMNKTKNNKAGDR